MKFYKIYLDEGRKKKYAEAETLSPIIGENIDCKVCNTKWVKRHIERPIEIILTRNYLPDYTAILPEQKIVSERFKDTIEKYALSDCEFEEIKTKTLSELTEEEILNFKMDGVKINKYCTEPSNYYAIHVPVGISIHPDMNVNIEICQKCRRLSWTKEQNNEGINKFLLHFILDTSSWKGYDLFTDMHFTNGLICTERFIDICKQEKITGMYFEEIETR
jgi:hypothetical protein